MTGIAHHSDHSVARFCLTLVCLSLQVPAVALNILLVVRALFCAAANLTTNELMRPSRFGYLADSRDESFLNPFDAGPVANCLQFWQAAQPADWSGTYSDIMQVPSLTVASSRPCNLIYCVVSEDVHGHSTVEYDRYGSIISPSKQLRLYAALQAGPEAVAKQVPRFSVTAAVRSAQLANKELAESRARRRRRREDYILLQVTLLTLWPYAQEMSHSGALLLHRQTLTWSMTCAA